MPRKSTILQNQFPYHVLNRTVDKHFFRLPLDVVWHHFEEVAFDTSLLYGVKIHALVLMSNHYHMMLSTPDSNISHAMMYFQSKIAKRISYELGQPSYRFQSRYKWSIVNNADQFAVVMAYVILNPVRAGITETAIEYPYSTWFGMNGQGRLRVPVHGCNLDPDFLHLTTKVADKWISNPAIQDESKQIQNALRYAYFGSKKKKPPQ